MCRCIWLLLQVRFVSCKVEYLLVRTNYRLLKLARLVQVEQLSSAESKDHALVVLLKLVVDLGRHKRSELAIREGRILVESLTGGKGQHVFCW